MYVCVCDCESVKDLETSKRGSPSPMWGVASHKKEEEEKKKHVSSELREIWKEAVLA